MKNVEGCRSAGEEAVSTDSFVCAVRAVSSAERSATLKLPPKGYHNCLSMRGVNQSSISSTRLDERQTESEKEGETLEGERSYEMMKQEGQEEGKHIKCKVGELDKEKGAGRRSICRLTVGKLYAAVFCPFFQSALEKMIALIIFLEERFSCHCIASRH